MVQTQCLKIGEVLVRHGVLSEQQVAGVLNEQQQSGRPFGELAERMFAVTAEQIERAWIDQYLSYGTEIDLDDQQMDVDVLKLLNRRQAWQFLMLPMRHEGSELIAATCRERLPRAVNFAWRRLRDPVFFLVAQRPQLEGFLQEHYPWPAMDHLPATAV
jgi:hypothetical protein